MTEHIQRQDRRIATTDRRSDQSRQGPGRRGVDGANADRRAPAHGAEIHAHSEHPKDAA